ncbi:MAG: exo-alpha-sialidase [Verrucomicrobia bacterium]|nr:exo-alpha-sialidase [Verrucomicrobiota bacterium]
MKYLLALVLLSSTAHAGIALHQKTEKLPFDYQGPFTRLGDGTILGVEAQEAIVSKDEGRSWEPRRIFDHGKFLASGERALLRTKEGVVLFAFLNRKELDFRWDQARGGPQEGCRVPVYVSRSADDGRTWAAPVLLQDGWCGAVRNMIQLRSGRVLLVCQKAVRDPGRHVTINYYSDDQGLTWQASNVIDHGEYGGYGDHGGGLEGTVIERRDGSLKLLLRTPQGCFQDMTSKDGATWTNSMPSTIEASDAPGMMMRLASGRVVLLWNRYMDPVKKLGRRQELSIAFSNNDGVTWAMPQVIATNYMPPGGKDSGYRLSYPYVFEPAPGHLWITTMQGNLRLQLNEADWLQPVEHPLDGIAVRIITLGDSITKGARPGVKPNEAFSALLQAALRQDQLRVQVHNVGIGGERTDQALHRLDRDVISQRPHFVTIMYGTNDSWVDLGKAGSRISADAYESNLREIIRRLKAANIQPIVMTAPMFGEENPKNGAGEEANVRIARYMERCRKVAEEAHVPLVDHFGEWGAAQKSRQKLQAWTTDGCHPNVIGHADLARRIAQVMRPLVK